MALGRGPSFPGEDRGTVLLSARDTGTNHHGVIGLTKNIAFQYALKGIRCNAICPGGVDTDIMAAVGMKAFTPFAFEFGGRCRVDVRHCLGVL